MRFPFAATLAISIVGCASSEPPPPLPPPTAASSMVSAIPEDRDAGPPADAAPPSTADAIRAAVAAPDRDEEDRKLDPGRHPAEMLSFFGIAPGQKVGELVAAGGYTSELLARVVGETGDVWAVNPRAILDKFAAKPWGERLAKPIMKQVHSVERDLDSPFPPEAHDLDAVVMVLFYHDAVWMKVDRAKMNKAAFDALKPGGVYGIIDHTARPGSGTADVQTYHRIDEKTVIDEVTKAGFKLAAEGDFLRNAKDTHDWNDSPRAAADKRGTSDRFALKFVKP
jgi:predicted methyltransferase